MIAALTCACFLLFVATVRAHRRLDRQQQYHSRLEIQLIQLRARINELEHRR